MSNVLIRLKVEREDLYDKLTKLRQFMNSTGFDVIHPVQQKLLRDQLEPMTQYHRVLVARIQHLEELEDVS